jgi:hypothetical protein
MCPVTEKGGDAEGDFGFFDVLAGGTPHERFVAVGPVLVNGAPRGDKTARDDCRCEWGGRRWHEPLDIGTATRG